MIAPQRYSLEILSEAQDWYPVLAGLLRGMADDYGVLAIVERNDTSLDVRIVDDRFTEGSQFSLAHEVGGIA